MDDVNAMSPAVSVHQRRSTDAADHRMQHSSRMSEVEPGACQPVAKPFRKFEHRGKQASTQERDCTGNNEVRAWLVRR